MSIRTCLVLALLAAACDATAPALQHHPRHPAADGGEAVAPDSGSDPSEPEGGPNPSTDADSGDHSKDAGSDTPTTPAADGGQSEPVAPAQTTEFDTPCRTRFGSTPAARRAATVENPDTYRVLDDQHVLYWSPFRGLQVIDVSDTDAPRIVARLAIQGTLFDMYVVGERAVLLIEGYDDAFKASAGVLAVDIHDRAHPQVVDRVDLAGSSIAASHMAQGNGHAALYLALGGNPDGLAWKYVIKSFDVSGGPLSETSQLDLGPFYPHDAGDQMLALQGSQGFPIDVSRSDGVMQRGGDIALSGTTLFATDTRQDILRVVSSGNGQHLQTFSLADALHPAAVDQCSFTSSSVYLDSLFLDDKAFVMPEQRGDQVHAFSIDAQGQCQEHAQYGFAGWHDVLRATLADTRLVGAGGDDESKPNTISVKLYDATDLDNAQALVARADLTLDSNYTRVVWDAPKLEVIEGAADAHATDNTHETGLILLPFRAYDTVQQSYLAQVQVLTFSDHTLTPRGIIDHGSRVRHVFHTHGTKFASMSFEEVRLWELSDPGAPQAHGRAPIAPNQRELFVFGDYVARVNDPNFYDVFADITPLAARVEIVPRDAELDSVSPIAAFSVPSSANLLQIGNLLVSVLAPEQSAARIQVYDLSDPTQPKSRGSLETDRVQPFYAGYSAPVGRQYYPSRERAESQRVVGNTLVFVTIENGEYSLDALDLHDPDQPVLAQHLALGEGSSLVPIDGQLYFSFGRESKCYFERIDFTDPSAAVVSAPINIPGPVFAADGDTIYTMNEKRYYDRTPGVLSRLTIEENLAHLQRSFEYLEPSVGAALKIASADTILLTMNDYYTGSTGYYEDYSRIVDARDLAPHGGWPYTSTRDFRDAGGGRALARMAGGLVLIDMRDPAHSKWQRFFPATADDAFRLELAGNDALLAAGPFGIYRFAHDAPAP